MSVVGPRPHRRFLDRHLQETVYQYMIRHYVNPGITGWAQVNGWRGPSETVEQKMQRTKHDLFYIEHWSFWLDIKNYIPDRVQFQSPQFRLLKYFWNNILKSWN